MSPDTDEWKAGMARGKEFAEKAGALGPYPAHGQSGQGVEEAFEAFAIKTLEKLNRKEEKAKADAEVHKAPQKKRMSIWGRLKDRK
ncbi:hypothetical protein CC79DRAFT_1335478 [Sarocladium strictum]